MAIDLTVLSGSKWAPANAARKEPLMSKERLRSQALNAPSMPVGATPFTRANEHGRPP
jgi:hypothetical protein